MDKDGIRLVGGIVPDLVERLKVISDGPFKQIIRLTSEVLFSAFMIAGWNAGVFDAITTQFKELTTAANIVERKYERLKSCPTTDKLILCDKGTNDILI